MDGRGNPPHEVLVRYLRTDRLEDQGLASFGLEMLSDEESAHLARLRPGSARRDYLAAHVLTRSTIGELAGENPASLRFAGSAGERPWITAPDRAVRFRFSSSRADGIALCAVARTASVGADVASLRAIGRDPLRLAEIACSELEKRRLRELPSEARAERLLEIWAVKEALAKAVGLGLRFPLTEATVNAAGSGRPEVEMPGETGWTFATVRIAPCHLAAVAVGAGPRGIVRIRFEEETLEGVLRRAT